ncbi:DUF1080 domain-containing protein [Pedobacter endophyticus]|uniref:DUF1080 domain-containing protein n=1 Tax=Pedobacter endophyticus TaxID=2789740 RepID=A0A7S9L059_9SPHI|nr:family 16 glycoside hydrolase [Pedobacter endophyticus]QPH40059.1 DUF1080 domain-containing protein [Pedobacter endophyticus]
MKKIFLALLVVFALQHMAYSQEQADQRTITTRIADLLAQMPAKDAKLLKNNIDDIAALGEAGYVQLITGLTAGKGNNAQLEYAIGGFSAYVSQSGQESLRKMSVNAYCKALQKLTDPQNRAFVISQFDLVGKDDAVSCLAPYLANDFLADVAARALVKINTENAKVTLLNGLSNAKGNARIAIVEALGDIRYQKAAEKLIPLATDADPALAKMALYSLAYIADPASEKTLAAATEKAGYKFENTNAVGSYLVFANQQLKNGNKELASKIAKDVWTRTNAAEMINVHIAALKLLVEATDDNQQLLLTAATDANPRYRKAALAFAIPYIKGGNTAAWVNTMNKAGNEVKADIINTLGKVPAGQALDAIVKHFNNKNPKVKLAAIDAAVSIGQDKVLSKLLKLMKNADSTTLQASSDAIKRMKGTDITAPIAAAIPSSKPSTQIVLLNLLASRAANVQLEAVYAQLKNTHPEVRTAAYAALSSVAISDNLPQLFNLLNESTGADELAVQKALVAAVNSGDSTKTVEIVLAQMNTAPEKKKALFYKVLASLGGNQSLTAVTDAYKAGNETTQKAAIEALAAWKDATASAALIAIARQTKNPSFLAMAIEGYLKQIRTSNATAEQKFLMLRNAMDVAQTDGQKQQILTDLAQAKCFNSLVFSGKYLDDPALQQAAAQSVMNITLSGTYNGDLVKNLLNKAIAVITGPDSGYQKEGMRKYINEMNPGEGFVSIFNGTDLTGWKGLVADPIKRSKMDAKTLAAEQEKADAEAQQSWKPINGELHFVGKGNNLATVKKYGDFEMLVDWKIVDDKKGEGDAGIYLRGTPQVQIWDNARTNVGAQVGSGGLYNNKVNESKPLKVADNKIDEWNTFRILMKGDRVTVYLNGELVTDNIILENYWDRNLPIFAEEQIELQAHGSPVVYRDIYIRELPRVKPFQLSATEKKEGYKVLFDGTNMHQWTGNTVDYSIEDGNIAIRPKPDKGSGGNLFTKDEFSDFIFRFEFQLTPGANNGLGIRAPLAGDAAYTGMELQILDNDAPIYKNLHVYQYHGSVYGTLPAKRGFLKPVGEWNYQEVIVKGPKIKVILNGEVILDGDITEARKNGAADGKEHPGLLRNSGHIGFLGHGSFVQFRNIRIKDLSKKK